MVLDSPGIPAEVVSIPPDKILRPDLQIENSIGQVHLADLVSQAPPFGVVVPDRAVALILMETLSCMMASLTPLFFIPKNTPGISKIRKNIIF